MSSLKDIQDKYPIFEANQVLSKKHLNQVFDYLDKQERLTRTHLIGIGIVCGFKARWFNNQIVIEKGCGVTSEGYLIKADEMKLTHLKPLAVTDSIYEPFKTFKDDIQELTVSSDPKKSNDSVANALKDKALVLFVELRNEGLRNCSPNNCDDKGREVIATIRPLLVPKGFQDKYIQDNKIPQIPHFQASESLALPDIRWPRIDVPRTGLSDAQNVLSAFLSAIREIEREIFAAIAKAQLAFDPIVDDTKIDGNLLKIRDLSATNIPFIQNYYDYLDDLIQAYNELRDKATDLFCSCCPDNAWFPQHLILGEYDDKVSDFNQHNRTLFIASPAVSDCEENTEEVKVLFKRLKTMLESFDVIPNGIKEVRITPTKQGAILSKKAIPYYYNNPVPALLPLWNPEKTKKKKEKQNLGYFAKEYGEPNFVKEPLKYDLETCNFLRIEGHLGQNYQEVIKTLIDLKSQNRLPVDIIALRAGSFDENAKIDFTKEKCHFEDLEAVYDAFREELKCSLGKTIASLGDIEIPAAVRPVPIQVEAVKNNFWFTNIATDFQPRDNTVAALIHNTPALFADTSPQLMMAKTAFFPTLDINRFISLPVFDSPPIRTSITFIGQITKILNALTADLADLDWEAFEKRYDELKKIKPEKVTNDLKNISEELSTVIYACRLEGLKSIIDEYRRRLKEVKQKQFLSFFLQKHPGIQHKAGVPMGGTFILVYHQDPEPEKQDSKGGLSLARPNIKIGEFIHNQMLQFPMIQPKITIGDQAFTLQGEVLAQFQKMPLSLDFRDKQAKPTPQVDNKNITEVVQKLTDGTVIADFFLPYMCTSDCAPVQFVLPKSKPTFTYKILDCPDPLNQGLANVEIKPQGGLPDYEVSLDGGIAYQKLAVLPLGGSNKVKIRDAEGMESIEQTIVIPDPIAVEIGAFVWENADKTTYKQTLTIKGGRGPYRTVLNDIILEKQNQAVVVTGLKNGVVYKLTVTDSNTDVKEGCGYNHPEPIQHSCDLPCGGVKVRSNYILPVQVRQESNKIAIKIIEFTLENETLVKDKAQDVSSLDKTLKFLMRQLNIKPEWAISDVKRINDANGRPLLLALQIERFVCQTFKIVLELAESEENKFRIIYTEKGVQIDEKNRRLARSFEYEIPAFEHEIADKCAEDESFKPRCQDNNFEIAYNFNRQTAVSLPDDAVTAWYWEKANGEKSNKAEQELSLDTQNLLIGFTKEGCYKIQMVAGPIG